MEERDRIKTSAILTVIAVAGALASLLAQSAGAATLPAVQPKIACTDLTKLDYANPTGIDFTTFPEAPFRIESATVVSQNVPQPYCDVIGYIAPRVRFEVKLPMSGWTQRLLVNGCGGFCGALT